jgi:enoyl-[acyl-carrier protein] reductase I
MLLKGRKGVVLGVANKRSIAWAIAKAARDHGADVALTYANERFKEGVVELGSSIGVKHYYGCDVSSDAEVDALAAQLEKTYGTLDFVVHAVAFAKKEELAGAFTDTTREGYRIAQDVSSYSLVALCRALKPLLTRVEHGHGHGHGHAEPRTSSVLTLTYLGGQRVVPNYNVMGVAKAALESCVRYLAADLGALGVRVNAVSAGPIRTLSAAGVTNFSTLLDQMPDRSPLKRNVTQEEVADAAIFLLSEMARGVTGEVLFVDAGFHAMGV